ncbi:electron transport protein [Bacillus canaveralius]|uniref:electron transport protein n=1 Tax=Bacillus canaveralius TaxID=1403243 RepID=UPI000F791738|nr:electron transport protein [Bacillus canaveralius]RSK52816.1 electron transport protein [Bacillus canaveralius]
MRRKWVIVTVILIAIVLISIVSFRFIHFEYAYMPARNKVLSTENRNSEGSYDIWGTMVSKEEAVELKKQHKASSLSAENGAVEINDSLLQLGRETFYKETFGNEVFLTDIMGVVDGPLTIANMSKAIIALKGQGTTNLRVTLAESAVIGDKSFNKGELIDTGIDVAKGSYTPLGMPVSLSDGRIRVGISCAACHATVDPTNKQVMEGVTNPDLNTGLIMALAPNTASYFTHSEVTSLKKFLNENSASVTNSSGEQELLPDPYLLENSVDRTLLKWPRGNFDSSIDMKSNPTQIPDAFTLGDHPFSWSGAAMAGPFKGLSAFSNNVHAQNSDSLAQAPSSQVLFGIDPEVYLGTILQNSAAEKYRYDPKKGQKPSSFFADIDPTPGVPGLNQMVKPPSFPKITLVAPDGLHVSAPDHKVNEQNNSVAAWQNTLEPPQRKKKINKEMANQGRSVFVNAGCISCHAGNYFTNNQVISSQVLGTEPTRAAAFRKTETLFGESELYAPNTPVPDPENAKVLKVPTKQFDPEQIKLAWAKDGSPGGYKVPSLIGLYWGAPYLHDGGVAVGQSLKDAGVANTILKGKPADPQNSLLALIDRDLRQEVIKNNQSSQHLQDVRVTGKGHEFWVDSDNGFSETEQKALVEYLMSLKMP